MSKTDIKLIYNLNKQQNLSCRSISQLKYIKYNHRRIKKLLNYIRQLEVYDVRYPRTFFLEDFLDQQNDYFHIYNDSLTKERLKLCFKYMNE